MRTILFAVLAALCMDVSVQAAQDVQNTKSDDLLFRSGTLTNFAIGQTIVYSQTKTSLLPNAERLRRSGQLKLRIAQGKIAELKYFEKEKYRKIGTFPISVGNPLILYFLESTIRQTARATGGSPFYIRNRLKEALTAGGKITPVSLSYDGKDYGGMQVLLKPFQGDNNQERLGAYANLSVIITMSKDVPGWYHRLVAMTPASPKGERYYHDHIEAIKLDGTVQ